MSGSSVAAMRRIFEPQRGHGSAALTEFRYPTLAGARLLVTRPVRQGMLTPHHPMEEKLPDTPFRLEEATREDAALVDNLLALYFYDFSEIPGYDIQPNGSR